jgi:uncharacterized membrane protein (UPF0182 family)
VVTRRWPLIALAGIALVLIAGRAIASLYADHLWYAAMGASELWRTRTLYSLLASVASSALAGGVIFLNLYAVRRSIVSLILPRRVANLEIGEEVPGRYLMAAVIGLAIVFGIMLDLPGNTWTWVVLALDGQPFRDTDPYYLTDLSFFVYWLPLETSLYLWALITVLVATALVLFFYALTPSLRWERGTLHVSGYVRRHLAVLAGLLLLLLAWSYRLDAFRLLVDGSGPAGEFLSVDRTIGVRVAAALAFVAAGAALVVLWGGWKGQLPIVFTAVSIVLVLSFVLRQIVPALDLGGDGDPGTRERPYLAMRRSYTARAFGVDQILSVDRAAAFRTWTEAAAGTPAWDLASLGRALGWPHGRSGGETMPSLRMTSRGLIATGVIPPADTAGAPTTDPWIVASARATRVDSRGAPLRVDHLGFPSVDDEAIPGVIVHPGATGYRALVDSLGMFPAPALETLESRLAHAWSLQNFRLLRTGARGRRTAIVTRRDVRARVSALVPFFVQGTSLTPLIAGDSLHWIIELYSSSATYPLSAPVVVAGDTRKYFRHAATAIVSAATGDVRLVRSTDPDPLASSWFARFPSLFLDPADLPRDLAALLPPIEDGAFIQGLVFARYGRRRESAPGGNLAWQAGTDSTSGSAPPLRVVLPLSSPAATWVQPVVDTTDHVSGVILATGGLNRATLWLPTEPSIRRWTQIIDQLGEGTDSAPPSRDVRWERGAVRALPVGDALAYTRTTYATRPSAPPVIGFVTVLTGDSLAIGPTLAHAVGVSFEVDDTPVTPQDFRARVAALHAQMRAAMQRGDWTAFGEAFDALGALLQAPRPLAPPPPSR